MMKYEKIFGCNFSHLVNHGKAKSIFGHNIFKGTLSSVLCFTGNIGAFPNPGL